MRDARAEFAAVFFFRPAAQLFALEQGERRAARSRDRVCGGRKFCKFVKRRLHVAVEFCGGRAQSVVHAAAQHLKIAAHQPARARFGVVSLFVGRLVVFFITRGGVHAAFRQQEQQMIAPFGGNGKDALAAPRNARKAAAEHIARIAAQRVRKAFERRPVSHLIQRRHGV